MAMMIKIDESAASTKAIEQALHAAHPRASRHTFDVDDVIRQANYGEARLEALGIPKADRAGAQVDATSGEKLPNAYSYPRVVTKITVLRRSSAWYLVACKASEAWNQEGPRYITLTAAQDAIVIAKVRSQYRIAAPVVIAAAA